MARSSRRPAAFLEIYETNRPAFRVGLDLPRAVFGRDPACAAPVVSEYVSWHHAVFEPGPEGCALVHEQTRNGLLLNGTPVEGRVLLNDGDELRVADVRIIFRRPDSRSATKAYPLLDEAVPAAAPTPAPAGISIDRRSRRLHVGGTPVPVIFSPQEFTLLDLLTERPGEVRAHKEIGDTIWGANRYDPNHVHALVARLKRKLDPHGLAGHITAIPGVGYRLDES